MVPEQSVQTISFAGGSNERIEVDQLRTYSYVVVPSPIPSGIT